MSGVDIAAELDERGYAVLPGLLCAAEARWLGVLFDEEAAFRKTVVMEALNFGRGVYKYFAAPLPARITALRTELYARLAPVANAWAAALGEDVRYPSTLAEMIGRCAAAGQARPTPLLLRYRAGDHNALHQDRYGDVAFPLQATVLLSEPGAGFSGGEFVLVENRPRRQSVARVVALGLGDAVVFPNDVRPVAGPRGVGRAHVRHGVSTVGAGERLTLGLIFHDAR